MRASKRGWRRDESTRRPPQGGTRLSRLASGLGQVASGVMVLLAMQPTVVSETGRRENNEDAAFASSRLAAVADGVGGAAAGEVASRLAIQKMIALDSRRIEHPLEQELGDAIADANDVIEFVVV